MDDVGELIRLLRERDGQDFDGEVHLTSDEAKRLTKALTVSPVKLEAASVAAHTTDCGCSDNGGRHMIYYRDIARAVATALGLRLLTESPQPSGSQTRR